METDYQEKTMPGDVKRYLTQGIHGQSSASTVGTSISLPGLKLSSSVNRQETKEAAKRANKAKDAQIS